MKDKNQITVCFQSRLESERVPRKMLEPFAGTTLFDLALARLELIDAGRKFVSCRGRELIGRAAKYGLPVYERTEASALEEEDIAVMFEWADEFLQTEWVVWFNPCLPMLKVSAVNDFVTAFRKSEADCMLAAVETKNYFFEPDGRALTTGSEALNTKTAPLLYRAAHAIYATRADDIRAGKLFGQTPGLWAMQDDEQLIDIDWPWQFKMAETYFAAQC